MLKRTASLRYFFCVTKIYVLVMKDENLIFNYTSKKLGPIAQSLGSPTANPGVVSWIPAGYHTLVEIII